MNRKVLFTLFVIVALALLISTSCMTARNAGRASEGSMTAVRNTGGQTPNVGEGILDAGITSAIKVKFAGDQLVTASNFHVDTTDGFVTLNGTVGSQAEADRAIELARSVDGVKSVRVTQLMHPRKSH